MDESIFAINCSQQGDRIKSYRNMTGLDEKYAASHFGCMLMSAGGKYISGGHNGGGDIFMASMVVEQKKLYPGTYYIQIDPTFNE